MRLKNIMSYMIFVEQLTHVDIKLFVQDSCIVKYMIPKKD